MDGEHPKLVALVALTPWTQEAQHEFQGQGHDLKDKVYRLQQRMHMRTTPIMSSARLYLKCSCTFVNFET